MKDIHRQITETFSKSFGQFVDIQSSFMETISKMPEKDARMFQKWMLNLNEGMIEQDTEKILSTIESIQNFKKNLDNGNSKVSQ